MKFECWITEYCICLTDTGQSYLCCLSVSPSPLKSNIWFLCINQFHLFLPSQSTGTAWILNIRIFKSSIFYVSNRQKTLMLFKKISTAYFFILNSVSRAHQRYRKKWLLCLSSGTLLANVSQRLSNKFVSMAGGFWQPSEKFQGVFASLCMWPLENLFSKNLYFSRCPISDSNVSSTSGQPDTPTGGDPG